MLEPSPRLRKEAQRLGCDANHIIMADLMLSGYTENEAYEIAYSERLGAGVKQKIQERESIFASEGYKRAYEEKRNTRKYAIEGVESREKDDVLKELNIMASTETDTKMKADLLMKIAEIKQMKKDVNSDAEDPVQFFLPIDCDRCPMLQEYNAYLSKRNKELPKEGREAPMRADEMQMIVENAHKRLKNEKNVS